VHGPVKADFREDKLELTKIYETKETKLSGELEETTSNIAPSTHNMMLRLARAPGSLRHNQWGVVA
jgi:hypothetical protein